MRDRAWYVPDAWREVAGLFLKLGCTAFGGPAAHISLMRREVVERRGWIKDDEFLDLLGGASMIPGPSSTELAILLGYRRAGVAGLLLAGTLFIAPAMLIVMGLAWAYVRFGSLPATGAILYGATPAVLAIIADALLGLTRTAVKTPLLGAIGIAVLGLFLMGVNPLILLVLAGIVIPLGSAGRRLRDRVKHRGGLPLMSVGILCIPSAVAVSHKKPISLGLLFLTFLKIGAVLFGGGYVLLAFVQDDFVRNLGWLTNRQVLDAVAIGQITPGPLFTTATFIGYLVAGVPGALLATLAIFLPAFVYSPVVFPIIPRLRSSTQLSGFLDGVNVAALGLMAAVTVLLGRAALIDVFTVTLAVVSFIVIRRKAPPVAVILVSGLLGVVWRLLIT